MPVRHPSRLWSETLPTDSWVRNLAQRAGTQRAHFLCPLGMDKVAEVLQQTRLALAETLVTCDRAEEACSVGVKPRGLCRPVQARQHAGCVTQRICVCVHRENAWILVIDAAQPI